MSKERARRRAEREREQAVKAAARAARAERQERHEARKRAVSSRLPRFAKGQSGPLAERHRNQLNITICLLVALNVVVWIAFHDWATRVLVLLVCVLAAPVVHMMLFRRR
jgi:Flp pilus assembly protein TadB